MSRFIGKLNERQMGMREERLSSGGVVPPHSLNHADPARAVGSEGIEPGKHRAARGVGQDADLVQTHSLLGDPRARHEFLNLKAVQRDDDALARIPQQVGEALDAQQGRVVSV